MQKRKEKKRKKDSRMFSHPFFSAVYVDRTHDLQIVVPEVLLQSDALPTELNPLNDWSSKRKENSYMEWRVELRGVVEHQED